MTQDWTPEPAVSVGSERLDASREARSKRYAAAVKADPQGVARYERGVAARLNERRSRLAAK
jgi:hypothetical protein